MEPRKKIEMQMPIQNEKEEILKLYNSNIPFNKNREVCLNNNSEIPSKRKINDLLTQFNNDILCNPTNI
jgi:hypothetical protein